MNAAKTPTVAIARVLRGLGLVQGKDFRVTGVYHTSGGVRERFGSHVIVLTRHAEETIAANADAVQDATAETGFTFRVSIYYSAKGRAFTTVRNFGETVRKEAPATEAPAEAAEASQGERAGDLADLVGKTFTKTVPDYQADGWPKIERTAADRSGVLELSSGRGLHTADGVCHTQGIATEPQEEDTMSGVVPANRGNKTTNRIGSVVSRKLRAAGWNIAPAALRHKRDVTTVAAMGDYVSVLADTGLNGRNRRIADGIAHDVALWPQVSDVETEEVESGAIFVRFTYRATSKGPQ